MMNAPQLPASKLPDVGTTIFTVMSQLAVEHNAVNLGQGFPDFPMPETLCSLVDEAMKKGFNQYTHMTGYPLLRERLVEKASFLYGADINPDTEITITPGGTYAIYTSLTSVLQPGDEVIVFEPAYDSYIPNIEVNGAVAVRIALEFPSYRIPWQKVKQAVTPRTRMIMINTPHNPTGMVLREDDIEQLRLVVQDTDILILSDEVYEHLIYDHIPHQSMLRYPDLMQRAFVCSSFGKTYHCTGWKLGCCIAPAALMKEFRKVHQFNCFSCDTPKQVGVAAYLTNRDAYLSLSGFLQEKRDFFRKLMHATAFRCIPSSGSYFECYSYAHLTDEPDKELAIRLTKEFGIATIPVSAFYKNGDDNKVLRFCFAKKNETLERSVEKLVHFR